MANGALNGDQINSTIYYLLSSSRAPLFEVQPSASAVNSSIQAISFHVERCYEGFSTLHAIKLWHLPLNELEVSSLYSLWTLTLQKHGCRALTEIGVYGVLQAIVLSLGGFKFTHHHLDLNLNPRQLHRDYYFRRINYANLSLISVEVVVDSDNHAKLYATLNHLIDDKQKFWACDAGCIDVPVELELYVQLLNLKNKIVDVIHFISCLFYLKKPKKRISSQINKSSDSDILYHI